MRDRLPGIAACVSALWVLVGVIRVGDKPEIRLHFAADTFEKINQLAGTGQFGIRVAAKEDVGCSHDASGFQLVFFRISGSALHDPSVATQR